MVKTQAMMILPATPQRTADRRFDEPTPRIEEEMTWVVLIGTFIKVASRMVPDATVSAAKPCTGVNLKNLMSQRANDPPPTQSGTERDDGGTGDFYPERDMRPSDAVGNRQPGRDQGEGDDPHRFLRIV